MSDALHRLKTSLGGRYEIERELGHGGMATVYLARDLRHFRLVAVKVLQPQLAAALGAERFLREIRIAAQLSHPHILTLIDSGTIDAPGGESTLFYVMPFVDGESLRDKLAKAGGGLPTSEATRLLRDIVDALSHAHANGVVHRDVKPDNVMVSGRHAMVVDFGVAKAVSAAHATEGLTSVGVSIGTPAYMAPEQAAADTDVDHRADIYSVGVVAYEMFTGKPPFSGSPQSVRMAHMRDAPQPILEVRPEIPPALAAIVMRCLEKDPANRVQSANELLDELESLTTPATTETARMERRRWSPGLIATAAATIILAAALVLSAIRGVRRDRWVRDHAIPEIRRLTEEGKVDSAFNLAASAAQRAPQDTTVPRLWNRVSARVAFRTQPAGAQVWRTAFDDTSRWEFLGATPLDSIRVPAPPAAQRYRIERPDYRTVRWVMLPAWLPRGPIVLDSANAPNAEMVRVTGGRMNGALPGIDNVAPVELRDFLIDRHEVTNAQYKAFVDAGGYSRREFWTEPIVRNGQVVAWPQAMRLFIDRTRRPGPATWEGGAPPPQQDALPVGGISWYEAMAYAKFAGKQLPTVFQWNRAARVDASAWVVPGSTFDAAGPTHGSTQRGMSPYGAFDMAGNVREWVYNEGLNGRYILGGAWSDPSWMFVDAYTQKPLDRSLINGVRLAKYDDEPNLALAKRPIMRAFRDFNKERPVSDAVYATFTNFYAYDPRPLRDSLVSRDTTAEDWIRERVTFDAAYGGERVPAVLFLPKRGRPPYQTIVYFPGSGAINQPSSAAIGVRSFDFIVSSGRAVVVPIYKSTWERRDSLKSDYADESTFYRDHVVMWSKDMRRTIDYLGTRADIDTTKLAYYGISWGGYLGGLLPATEPRLKTAVLYVAGLEMERAKPEADPINFLPRIKIPVIMLNGKHDYFFPDQTSQEPMFRLLGTPAEHKRWVVYEGGHFVPRTMLIKETLDWLDKYLGPLSAQ